MARKTKKIIIPINNPDDMFRLLEAVSAKNEQMVPITPLGKYNMSDFSAKTLQAKRAKAEARDLDRKAQARHQDSDSIIGSAPGQSVQTEGTLYNSLTRMRDTLLDFYNQDAEQLGQWGFTVVTGEAKSPTRKPK